MSNKTKRESEIQQLERELANLTEKRMFIEDWLCANSRQHYHSDLELNKQLQLIKEYSHEIGVISERMRRLTVRKTRFFRKK